MSAASLAFLALGVCCAVFAAGFGVARRLDNYGIVDVLWSLAFGPLALGCAILASGWAPRRVLIAGLGLAWCLRLGLHLWRRVARHHPEEDVRYRELRRDWAANFSRTMFGFFQLQAVSVVLLSAPILLALGRPEARFTALDGCALALFLVAFAGEAVADAQLAAFKKSAPAGRVCDTGLWALSRHPNYFFAWLSWVAFSLFGLSAPHGWLGLVSPACLLLLLLFVTGLPPTERNALRSKGEAYRAYQRRVSAFVPWFPKPPPASPC